jgi:hypothetical protein
MIPFAVHWSDVPLPVVLTVFLTVAVICAVVALPRLRLLYRRRQWKKLPPPRKPVEKPEPVLRLPRRRPGDGEFEI